MTEQRNQKKFQFTLTLLLLHFILFVPVSNAADVPSDKDFHSSCNSDVGIGQVFNDFKALNVIYANFPHPGDEKLPGFPEALKLDAFNKRLIDALRSNFKECLKTEDGEYKPIIVYGPPLRQVLPKIATLKSELGELPKDFKKEIHSPQNLTLVLRVDYNEDEMWPKDAKEFQYGLYSYYFYRPEIKEVSARYPQYQNSAMGLFYTKRGDDVVQNSLDVFFSLLKPVEVPTVSPYSK